MLERAKSPVHSILPYPRNLISFPGRMHVRIFLISCFQVARSVRMKSEVDNDSIPSEILDLAHRHEHGLMLDIMASKSIRAPAHLDASPNFWGGNDDLRRISVGLIEVGRNLMESGHMQSMMPQINFTSMLEGMVDPLPAAYPGEHRKAALLEVDQLGKFRDTDETEKDDTAYKYNAFVATWVHGQTRMELPNNKGVVCVGLTMRALTVNLKTERKAALGNFWDLKNGFVTVAAGAGVYIVKTSVEFCPRKSFTQEIGFTVKETKAENDHWLFGNTVGYGGCFEPTAERKEHTGKSNAVKFASQICGGNKYVWKNKTKTSSHFLKLTLFRETAEGELDSQLQTRDSFSYVFKGAHNESSETDDWTLNSFGLAKRWVPDAGGGSLCGLEKTRKEVSDTKHFTGMKKFWTDFLEKPAPAEKNPAPVLQQESAQSAEQAQESGSGDAPVPPEQAQSAPVEDVQELGSSLVDPGEVA
mmetsp:Transcript_33702/g.76391  ORF Transcript_33702/g.76391 Transcript_33702/m.76391 type:complete len:473 (-) Transcript_33702:76-1494(-)